MKRNMIIIIVIIIAIPALYVGSLLILATVTKYKPAPMEEVKVVAGEHTPHPMDGSPNLDPPLDDTSFTFMTWNIGYCGEGAETDFFYDSGKGVIAPETWVKKYTAGVYQTIKENGDADFIFIQEADRKGKRSWNTDEVAGIASQFPDRYYAFAVNYDVKYLPFPWTEPLGRIYGGLMTLSKHTPIECTRISLPNITDWPRKIFYLERCLMLQRFKLANGKDLVVINTHFEAYDDGGVKKAEMAVTKKLMEAEYVRGNYVVLGGDWNIAPPDFNIHKWEKVKLLDRLYTLNNDPDYIPGWKYVYDGNTPSNRKNDHPFDETTYTTVIDYFFISPNIEVEEIKGINAGFKNSDHNPVRMKIRLKQ